MDTLDKNFEIYCSRFRKGKDSIQSVRYFEKLVKDDPLHIEYHSELACSYICYLIYGIWRNDSPEFLNADFCNVIIEKYYSVIDNAMKINFPDEDKSKLYYIYAWSLYLLKIPDLKKLTNLNFAVRKDNPVEIMKKAINLTPENPVLWQSLGDISIKIIDRNKSNGNIFPEDPILSEDYYVKSLKLKKNINIFVRMCEIYRNRLDWKNYDTYLKESQKNNSNNSFFDYCRAEMSLDKPSSVRDTKYLQKTVINDVFLKYVEDGNRKNYFLSPHYDMAVPESFKHIFNIVMDYESAKFVIPTFLRAVSIPLTNMYELEEMYKNEFLEFRCKKANLSIFVTILKSYVDLGPTDRFNERDQFAIDSTFERYKEFLKDKIFQNVNEEIKQNIRKEFTYLSESIDYLVTESKRQTAKKRKGI